MKCQIAESKRLARRLESLAIFSRLITASKGVTVHPTTLLINLRTRRSGLTVLPRT